MEYVLVFILLSLIIISTVCIAIIEISYRITKKQSKRVHSKLQGEIKYAEKKYLECLDLELEILKKGIGGIV